VRTTTTPGPTGTLVLDFDGTVCLGDDPVRLYCEEVVRVLPQATGTRITASLDGFLDGHAVAGLDQSQDGYQAVQRLAAGAGVHPAQLDVAYRDSRRRFDAGEGRTWVPDGLLEELAVVRTRGVDLILVTNAPMLGVRAFADRTGLTEQLTGVVADARKPTGMAPILQRLLDRADHPATADERRGRVGQRHRAGARSWLRGGIHRPVRDRAGWGDGDRTHHPGSLSGPAGLGARLIGTAPDRDRSFTCRSSVS